MHTIGFMHHKQSNRPFLDGVHAAATYHNHEIALKSNVVVQTDEPSLLDIEAPATGHLG